MRAVDLAWLSIALAAPATVAACATVVGIEDITPVDASASDATASQEGGHPDGSSDGSVEANVDASVDAGGDAGADGTESDSIVQDAPSHDGRARDASRDVETDSATCDPSSCPDGCCDRAGECVAFASQGNQKCGAGGLACGSCAPDQECNGKGECVCNASTCSGGCCTARVGGSCQTPSVSSCGTGGALCATCQHGQDCLAGSCQCTNALCNDGCCGGAQQCVTFPNQNANTCGPGGTNCRLCVSPDSCSAIDGHCREPDGGIVFSVPAGCSGDGSGRAVVGAFARDGATTTFTESCAMCASSDVSRGVTWWSTWTAERDAIDIAIASPEGVRHMTMTPDGAAVAELAPAAGAPFERVESTATCDGIPVRPTSIIGDWEWQNAATAEALTWEQASAYCAQLSLGDDGDRKLPTRRPSRSRASVPFTVGGDLRWHLPALEDLVNVSGIRGGARVFNDEGWFWSADPAGDARAWAATTEGAVNANRDTSRARVRCVR